MEFTFRTCKPEEQQEALRIENMVWARFNAEAEGSVGISYFPELHIVAFNKDGEMVATIDACPFDWDGNKNTLPERGWTEIVIRARGSSQEELDKSRWVGVLGASIKPEYSGKGLSTLLLQELKKQVKSLGYEGMLAPVRPMHRARAPHLPLKEYVNLRLPDGEHFDPWVRVHERIGGEVIGYCVNSASFKGTREQWEKWLGMKLPDNGKFLAPKTIGWLKLTRGQGYLIENSIWIKHSC